MGWGEPTMHPDFVKMLEIIDRHSARKYFCTNGMKLDVLREAIFDFHVDVFAVSLDGAKAETNNKIRRGSDIDKIAANLIEIEKIKRDRNLAYPWINFVFCAMKQNLHELPDMVRFASKVGIDEVKVVYLTAFNDALAKEVLWDCADEVREVFNEAVKIGEELNIDIKIPHVQGEDAAGDKEHKDCFVCWRDFFLGSDGYIRPCMSTPVQFENLILLKIFLTFRTANIISVTEKSSTTRRTWTRRADGAISRRTATGIKKLRGCSRSKISRRNGKNFHEKFK